MRHSPRRMGDRNQDNAADLGQVILRRPINLSAQRGQTLLMNVGIVCDFLEERWFSMDFVADILMESLPSIDGIHPQRIRPEMKLRFTRLRNRRPACIADRLINRLRDYPRHLKSFAGLDLYHIVDHSYAHLVHVLPADRVVVTCHDTDTFRCLFAPQAEPRSYLFKRMALHILSGLQKARRVACDSVATRDALLYSGAMTAAQLEVVPLGINPTFCSEPDEKADREASALLGEPDSDRPEVLHVGSIAERKRIDVLLNVFAAVKRQIPSARLIRAGALFNLSQQALLHQLEIAGEVKVFPHLNQRMLAALYRRAAVTLMPSDREGFGLPVAEAMACGACVIASNLPVLRETGGDAAIYCPGGDFQAWVPSAVSLIREKVSGSDAWRQRVAMGLKQASQFTSVEYARRMSELYRDVCRA